MGTSDVHVCVLACGQIVCTILQCQRMLCYSTVYLCTLIVHMSVHQVHFTCTPQGLVVIVATFLL